MNLLAVSFDDIIQKNIPAIEKIDQLNNLAYSTLSSDAFRAVEIAEHVQALLLQSATPYQQGLVDASISFAWGEYRKNNLLEALKIGQEALEWYELRKQPIGIMRANYIIGITYRRMGNYDLATDCHLKQLDIADELGDVFGQIDALNVLGIVSGVVKHFSEADTYFLKALELCEEVDYTPTNTLILVNMIDLRIRSQDYNALPTLISNVTDLLSTGTHSPALLIQYVGRAYQALEEYEKALIYYEQSLSIYLEQDATLSIAWLNIYMGECYLKQHRYDLALDNLKRGILLLSDSQNIEGLSLCHKALAATYDQTGDTEAAYYHFKQFHKLQKQELKHEASMRLMYNDVLADMHQAQHRNELLTRQREEDRQYFEHLSEMKDELLSIASHDLKNPLASMMLSVPIMRRLINAPDKLNLHLDNLEEMMLGMRELVVSLLDVAKLETGRALEIEPTSLRMLIDSQIRQLRPLAETKSIQLTINHLASIEEVQCDRLRLQQVIENLVSNAIKYTSSGGHVTLNIDNTETALLFQVHDSGIGIPDEDIPFIFERFYRVNNEKHLAEEGTGLGLAIAKSVVEQHGGEIWIESSLGEGSIFNFSIPI